MRQRMMRLAAAAAALMTLVVVPGQASADAPSPDEPTTTTIPGTGGGHVVTSDSYITDLECVGQIEALGADVQDESAGVTDVWAGVECFGPDGGSAVFSFSTEIHLGTIAPPVTAPPDGG